jgi:Flp pilus assembly protein TadG
MLFMSRFIAQFLRRFLREQVGQSAVVVAVTITAITAVAATSVEVGHVYYAYQQLVESTNQAALAGAQAMSTALTSTASSGAYTLAVTDAVKQYSSVAGQLNASSFLQNDAIATQTEFCSTTMSASPFNVECQLPPGSLVGYNAIKVVQSAKVNLWFGGLIGMSSMNLVATSTAAMKGASNTPYNLAVIMDTTASMADTVKGDKNCTKSQISCAVAGLEAMLSAMDPCQLNTTCTSSTPYVDNVALFVFPAVAANSTANYHSDYCGSGMATVPYNFINVTPGWTDPQTGLQDGLTMETTTSSPSTNAGAYGIIPFNTAYKTNDSASLSISSALAEAVSFTGTGCSGLSAPGGQQTYYAQVIYTAQAALVAQQLTNTTSKNIMIILSDGDATACATNADTAAGACNSAPQIVADNNPTCALAVKTAGNCLNGTGTSVTNPAGTSASGASYGYNSPTYPSALGECGQAVQAAQLATAAGTVVYTIGFGSETSGCASDGKYTINSGSTDGAQAWPGGSTPGTPCNAIAAMASNPNTFYSDASAGCPSLTAANKDFTSLVDIFDAITTGLTSPRLIPNGTP